MSTTAQYSIGAPQRPPIHHDNGFLQNPSDSNDPTPIPTTEPSVADRASLLYWQGTLEAAEAAQGVPRAPHNNIPDALAAYRHFLYGNGANRTFSYERFVANDASGAIALRNAIRDIQICIEKFYRKMVDDDPSLATRQVTFQLTGTAIAVGSDSTYPYPSTENWQKAIGAHSIWMSGTVVVEPAPCSGSGEPRLEMRATLHAEDRYNFNPNAADITTGIPDDANGRFEATGLAHQYMNYATLQRDVTWMLGHPEAGTTLRMNGTRQRSPGDNRRARNRV
ncbi:hypothetical protein [Sorangium sp. So ce426]|uniref:hypothetical protein n=1 Tax=Sorangium sp. So ce426 TaxID=3133312 RepID=UPI003F5C14CC